MKLKWIVVSGLMIVALVATACATLVKPVETAHGQAAVAHTRCAGRRSRTA